MAAPFFSTPFQPFVYQSPQNAATPFQILGGEAQIAQIMLKPQEKVIAKPGLPPTCLKLFMPNFIPDLSVSPLYKVFLVPCATCLVLSKWKMYMCLKMKHLYGSGFLERLLQASFFTIQIDLALIGGEMLCQMHFFARLMNVKVNNTVDPRARNVITSAEGFLRQKISGRGLAFVTGGGSEES